MIHQKGGKLVSDMFHPLSININGEDTGLETAEKKYAVCNDEWEKEGWDFLRQLLNPEIDNFTFYTSGTTGAPKPIQFTREQLYYSAENSCRFFDIQKKHRLLLCLPMKFVAGRLMMVRALCSGASLVWVKPSLLPLELISPVEIHFAAFTPAQVYSMLQDKIQLKMLTSIHSMLIGGGETDAKLEEEITRLHLSAWMTYGMTETLTHIAVRKAGTPVYKMIYTDGGIGQDENGCLTISLPRYSNHPIVTRDIVKMYDSQSFEWLGRLDNVINSGGIKIQAEEMEKKILQQNILPFGSFYISSIKDEKFGQRPVLVTTATFIQKDNELILKNVNALLNKHEQVERIIILDKFEYTVTGKMKRERF